MRSAIVTGAAGFSGAVLVEQLRKKNIETYALVRPGSRHNIRLSKEDPGLHVISLDPERYRELPQFVDNACDICFHLMWSGSNNVSEQVANIDYSLDILTAAAQCGCTRFVATGSQAEYGAVPAEQLITEEVSTDPLTAYGAAKVAACRLTYIRAKELGIDWIWGRIFSLIGRFEPRGRMLPDLYCALQKGEEKSLSSCRQNWDYLDVYDSADALIAMAENGNAGEIYNIASGEYRPLRDYTEKLRQLVAPELEIHYGEDPAPFISLQPSVEKLIEHTGWRPKRSFEDSIMDYREQFD